MDDATKELLGSVSDSLQNSCSFNAFEILGVERLENKMRDVMVALLDPNGTHEMGDCYLKLFFSMVLDKPYDGNNVNVYKEKVIKDDRRIDIFITDGGVHIPIEVKIDAGDRENQCLDYYQYAIGSKIYYLTIEGRMPEVYSASGLTSADIEPLSWGASDEGSILKWLDDCIEITHSDKHASVRESMRMFSATIKNFYIKRGKVMENILSSAANVQAAIEISKHIPSLKKHALDRIDETLKDIHGFKSPDTNDIDPYWYRNYVVDENAPIAPLFFRISYSSKKGFDINAFLLTGEKKNGKWGFDSGDSEYRKNFDKINIKGKDKDHWWLCKMPEIIKDRSFHLLFDETKFDGFIDEIYKCYKDFRERGYGNC